MSLDCSTPARCLLFVSAVVCSFAIFSPTIAESSEPSAAPETPKIPAVDIYFEHKVPDDYQWLENSDDKKVFDWTKDQTARSTKYLDSIPERQSFLKEFRHNVLGKSVGFENVIFAGGKVFAVKSEPPKAQPTIISADTLAPGAPKRSSLIRS